MTQWEKNQRFGSRVAHRIKMTEKINRKVKERNSAEMTAYETRKFKFEFYPSRDKPKNKEKQSMGN